MTFRTMTLRTMTLRTMAWNKPYYLIAVLLPLTACAEPDVWSAVAPAYDNGIAVTHVRIDVSALKEPERSWSAQAMAQELAKIGVTPLETSAPENDAQTDVQVTLAMEIYNQQMVTVHVPEKFHPGDKKITTEEKDGKVVTTVKKSPSYTTGGYSYKVPVVQSRFGLVRSPTNGPQQSGYETIWTANVETTGERGTTLAELAVESARKAVRQLGWDRVLRPPPTVHTAQR